MKESSLQDSCIAYLKEKDIYYINKYGDGMTARGCPDLLVCLNGRFVAFELKVGKNHLSDAQIINKNKIIKNNGLHYVPYTFDKFKLIIDTLRGKDNDL